MLVGEWLHPPVVNLLYVFVCVEQFIEQLVEQAEKLTNNGNASPVGQESSAGADESGENIQNASDKG